RMISFGAATVQAQIADGFSLHLSLPAPEPRRRQEVVDDELCRNGHDLPGRITHELGYPDDEPLTGGQPLTRGRVPIADVLKERFGIDRSTALPIQDRPGAFYPCG